MSDVYLEIGKRRTFAGAVEWPGWCRSGRDEAAALQALLEYGSRYAGVIRAAQPRFEAPTDVSAFRVVERLEGNATTDYGAPGAIPSADSRPLGDVETQQFQALLEACWTASDQAAQATAGKELRKGLRGGGRDLESITRHVVEADASYLSRLAWKIKITEEGSLAAQMEQTRQAIREALAAAGRGQQLTQGPRGGALWPARYFVRRVAWHVLDHAWEIEDRI